MNQRVQWARKIRKVRTHTFLLILFVVIPLVCCTKKSTNPRQVDITPADRQPAWSPDGHTIAYRHGPRGGGQDNPTDTFGLYLIDTSGTNKRILVPNLSAGEPAFSPDGQWLAFSLAGAIYKIRINGDSVIQITAQEDFFSPIWSFDGKFLLFSKRFEPMEGVWFSNDTGSQTALLISDGDYPNWSNDDKRILCTAFFLENNNYINYVTIFNRLDSTFRKLKSFSGTQWRDIRWNPSNDRILITTLGATEPFLSVMDTINWSIQQLVAFPAEDGDWSPDGEKIVFVDARPEVGRLVIMNKDGSGKKQLTF